MQILLLQSVPCWIIGQTLLLALQCNYTAVLYCIVLYPVLFFSTLELEGLCQPSQPVSCLLHFLSHWRCPLEASIRADAYALKALKEYCHGKCILYAWIARGYVTKEIAATWHASGDIDEFHDLMKSAENKMLHLVRLAKAPELEESKASKRPGTYLLAVCEFVFSNLCDSTNCTDT